MERVTELAPRLCVYSNDINNLFTKAAGEQTLFSHTLADMKYSKNKYIVFFFFIFLIIGKVKAQDISVTEFYLDESDLTANREKVEDQNGDKCALIRVQTTQKGFLFDVGSAGITKIEDNHVGEIWLWVPYGIKHISIRHDKLGSMPRFNFPITIQKARTYIMNITHEQIFVTNYNDAKKTKLSIKITPPHATLFLNGMSIKLNSSGEGYMEMAHGQFTYKVEAAGFYPKEGTVTVDDSNNTLVISGLNPIKGKLGIHTSPINANICIDGKTVLRSSIKPIELQIGEHEVTVSADGYKTEVKSVTITENQTKDISISLSKFANYKFSTTPHGASIYVNEQFIGVSTCEEELTTGTYTIKATKKGYKDFEKQMVLNSSKPIVEISLKKIHNYKNEFYVEGNVLVGNVLAYGATIGGYFSNFNIEASYLYSGEKSENIYWNSKQTTPRTAYYSPSMNVSAKIGYGIPIGTRLRITPQIGTTLLKLTETLNNNSIDTIADGANVISGNASIRFSFALIKYLAISLSPTYSFNITKSKGYTALSEVSPKIGKWGEGFNIKLGITTFF